MADPILESSLKTTFNSICRDIFLLINKKVDKFQLCLKMALSLFPMSFVTFLIAQELKIPNLCVFECVSATIAALMVAEIQTFFP